MENRLYKQAFSIATAAVLLLPVTSWSANVDAPTSGTAALELQAYNSKVDDIRIKVGDVDLHPHLGTAFTYDDNIAISGNNPQGDFYALITPGVQFQYEKGGNNISLDYTAGIQRFFRLSEFDTVDHNAALVSSFEFSEKLRVTVSQGFSRSIAGEMRDQVGIPVTQIGERIPGTRTEVQNFTTAIGAEYELSQKTALGLNFAMSFTEYIDPPGLFGNDTYDVKVPFYYHLSSKTDLFIDANAGATSMDDGANQVYEGFGVGARTRLTGKIMGSVRVGYQHRDYSGTISAVDTAVASANLDWAIGPRTALMASVNRNVNPSAAAINNYYESTALDVTVRQKVWHDKITLSAGGGYERDDYGEPFATFTGSGVSSDRSDDYYYLKVGCDYAIRRWWSAGANYRFRSNVSALSAYDFDNNLVSIYTRVSF
ncbi:MAG: outer membrane beta-barrel protein [Verrucomicrobiia bacterium]|jgi:hypothetical protein